MKADYMVLADAVAAADGKLYIHGAGWDNVLTQNFPATLTMGVAILLRIPWGETNEAHILELDILDADGHSVLPNPPGALRGMVNVGRPATLEPGDDQVVPLAINLNGTKIERAGRYVVILQLDKHEVARTSFRVRALPLVQPPADPTQEPSNAP